MSCSKEPCSWLSAPLIVRGGSWCRGGGRGRAFGCSGRGSGGASPATATARAIFVTAVVASAVGVAPEGWWSAEEGDGAQDGGVSPKARLQRRQRRRWGLAGAGDHARDPGDNGGGRSCRGGVGVVASLRRRQGPRWRRQRPRAFAAVAVELLDRLTTRVSTGLAMLHAVAPPCRVVFSASSLDRCALRHRKK